MYAEDLDEVIESIDNKLSEKLNTLPTKPGIYQFKNDTEKVIYVGKAKNLKSRVRSYFQQGKPQDAKTRAMIGKINDLDIILVDSEVEALLLEDNLIKSLKPKYNILLRDDKTYPYIRVTSDPFPRIFPTRRVVRDGSKYFGPFTEVRHIKYLIRALRTIFQVRSCDLKLTEEGIKKKKFKICLDYHIKKCQGPCEGLISSEEYNNNIRLATQILTGKTRDLEKQLETEMLTLSDKLQFEKAAIVRNRLTALQDFTSKQKIISADLLDRDVFGLARVDESACSIVLKIRDGKLLGKRHFFVKNAELEKDEDIIQKTMEKWYLETDFIPKEIFLPCQAEQLEYITDWLGKKRGKSITISIPKVGDKRGIVELANSNAQYQLAEYLAALAKREQIIPRHVISLQRDLKMKNPPLIIECFDNSHFQGTDLVASLVVFAGGKPRKSEYRKYKIKTVDGNNDFAAMQEVIHRRYIRMIDEKKQLPDLIIVDGGKGQLSSAVSTIQDLGIFDNVKIIGLAKRLEEVFAPFEKDPILLPKSSSSLKLLQQIRDEAHRFAITFHRLLREKRTFKTELTEIKGIGKATAQKLLSEFGSVDSIKSANLEKLKAFVSEKQASAITNYFNSNHPSEQ